MSFIIQSKIELKFPNSKLRDIAFNSFFPELKKAKLKRSHIQMEKSNLSSILFSIVSSDITAFRASINDIISFGKIIENTIKLSQ